MSFLCTLSYIIQSIESVDKKRACWDYDEKILFILLFTTVPQRTLMDHVLANSVYSMEKMKKITILINYYPQ